jgi:hypothetical protein
MDFGDPELAQPFHNKRRRLLALLAQFGVLVQMAPPRGHIIRKRGDSINNGHMRLPYVAKI